MPMARGKGLKKVTVEFGGKKLERERAAYEQQYPALTFEGHNFINSAGYPLESMDIDIDDDDFSPPDSMNEMFPPGEEALLHSHEGREYEEILSSFMPSRHYHADDRDRQDCIQKQTEAWAPQYPALVDAYLAFLAHGPPSNDDNQSIWLIESISFESNQPHKVFHIPGTISIPVTLARHGLIACSPEKPGMAFSVHFLHSFQQIHRTCPRYSIDTLARSVQHIHFLPRGSGLDEQLRSAYDTYLEILRQVKELCLKALHCDTEAAKTSTTCPLCTYQLTGENPLSPSMLIAMDGNNSLKLVDTEYKTGRPRTDNQTLADYRWIEDEEVDQFKDEVKAGSKLTPANAGPSTSTSSNADAPSNMQPLDKEEVAWLDVLEEDDLAACIDTCVDRWRNAGPESKKKMCQMFAIAGVFLAVC
ncbi:hypothetical protein L218DRAFT_1005215 [Marasmius fiardii PR-910]|nr:hypothetical protein L218DRAFT_1005215 [Marasmius fiardii PR-910]